MKTHHLLILAAVLTFTWPALSRAEVLAQTSDNHWDLDATTTLVGTNEKQTLTATTANTIAVDQYLGALDLARVVITVLQPNTGQSPIISSDISITSGSGSVTFDNASLSEETDFQGNQASIYAPLINNGGGILGDNVNKVSDNSSNFTIANTETKHQQVDITDSKVWFDSANTSMTSEQLNTVFRTASNLSFGFNTSSTFAFERTGTTQIQADIGGLNSGRIQVDYYVVPEPSSLALLGIAGTLGLLARRRRRATVC